MIKFHHTIRALLPASEKGIFKNLKKPVLYYQTNLRELYISGINSIGIIAIISFFMGAVITLQTAYNTENRFIPSILLGSVAAIQ